MQALVFRAENAGLTLEDIAAPVIDPKLPADADQAIVKIIYTGICGTDKHIWAHDPSITAKMAKAASALHKNWLVAGHELLGQVVAVGAGVSNVQVGAYVSAESHLICGECFQCRNGQNHVCVNELIIGVTTDGCFAEYCKLPARTLWSTDVKKIPPALAAVQEPFGNAVHVCEQVDMRGKTVAVFGCGTIGLMCVIIAKAFGAAKVIGIEPNPKNIELAADVGADFMVKLDLEAAKTLGYCQQLCDRIFDYTGGQGVDVALEISGQNDSINNALNVLRRGGDAIFFGIPSGDKPIQIEDYSRNVIFKGVTMHGVVGRRVFKTWNHTRQLLEQPAVAAKMLKIVSRDPIPHKKFREAFVSGSPTHPKVILEWSKLS